MKRSSHIMRMKMNNNNFKKFLRQEVYSQRELFLENRSLTESQKSKKIIAMIRESENLDEGFMDNLMGVVGAGKEKVKDFIATRIISSLGVPSKHPLNTYFRVFLRKKSMKQIQAILLGEKKARLEFAELATQATMKILKDDFTKMFGLKQGTFIGDSISDGISKAISNQDFEDQVRKSFYESLGNVADSDLDSEEASEDTDGDGVTDGEEQVIGTDPQSNDEPESVKQRINKATSGEEGAEKAKEAAEEASEAADKAEKAEASGNKPAAEEAAKDAQQAAEKAEDAAEGASDVAAAEAAAKEARKKAAKAEASKLRIPMRDFIKAKLNLDNDLGRYDPRISLEDLQTIHDNFVAAETDQQKLAAIETFARVKTFEELTKLIGAPDAEAPAMEPEASIEEPVEEPADEAPEAVEAEIEGAEAEAAEEAAEEAEAAAEKEPDNEELKNQAEEARKKADVEKAEAEKKKITRPKKVAKAIDVDKTQEYDLSLSPAAEKERDNLLDTIEEVDAGGNIELYKTNLNKYLDQRIDGFFDESVEKGKKSKAVKDGKKTQSEFTEEYVIKQSTKLLQQINKKIKEDGTTAGLSYIFGRAAQEAGEGQEEKSKDETKYRQVDVVLDDDKTIVMSSRVGEKVRMKRPKLGEGIINEERKEVFSVELPPIPVEDVPKTNWTQSSDQQRVALAAKVLELLKIKQQEDPDSVGMLDLGQDEETGMPNLVVMPTSLNVDNTVAGGVIDQRKLGVIEIPSGKLQNLYQKLVRNYITKTVDKKAGIVPGMFNSSKAVSDFPERVANTLVGKNLKSLADLLGVSYDSFELEMPFVIEDILTKTGDLVSFKKSEQPKSKAPEMTADELGDLEDEFEKSLENDEEDDENTNIEEVLNITEDQLRRLLA